MTGELEAFAFADGSLAFADLLPGDILLCRPVKESASREERIVSAKTRSPYTHASIFLGEHTVAEAADPCVQRTSVVEEMKGWAYVGVLRSQYVFSRSRAAQLTAFVDLAIGNFTEYDGEGVLRWSKTRTDYELNSLAYLHERYGQFKTVDELARGRYFCSAFVVACYMAVQIIGPDAQVAYPPEALSPGDLHRDDTFGYVLGYLIPTGNVVPDNDPLRNRTHWSEVGWQWW